MIELSIGCKKFIQIKLDYQKTEFAKRKYCSTIVNCRPKCGISSLNRHKCKIEISQSPITNHLIKLSPTDAKSKIAKSSALFCSRILRPFNLIDGEGFQCLAQQLINIGAIYGKINFKHIKPLKNAISNYVYKICNEIEDSAIKNIENIAGAGITCDLWVHHVYKTNYLTITAQYIKSAKSISRVLSTIPTEDKTANTTKLELNYIMQKFGLNNITKYFVIDNDSAMIKAFANDDWISCAAHNLNLVQFHSFKILGNNSSLCKTNFLIHNFKELVSYAKRSGLQNLLSLTLNQSIDVRWDRKLIMLESIKKIIPSYQL